jgi:hypothetical protein
MHTVVHMALLWQQHLPVSLAETYSWCLTQATQSGMCRHTNNFQLFASCSTVRQKAYDLLTVLHGTC